MAEAEFVHYLDISDVEQYCKSSNAEEKQNVICNKITTKGSISSMFFFEYSSELVTRRMMFF